MGSIESLFIGEQAKNLREAAGLTLDHIATSHKLTSADLKAFENGELYSSEVINSLYQMYFQAIESHYAKQEKSFLKFIEEYCQKNDLDYTALLKSYYDSIANVAVNNSTKEEVVDNLGTYIFAANTYKDLCLKSNKSTNLLLERINQLMRKTEEMHNRYLETHSDYTRNSSKAEILIQLISASEYKEDVLEGIRENMGLEREDDFPEHEEEAYKELLHDIETYWDFLNKGE